MVLLEGLIYDPETPERFHEGTICVEDGIICGEEDGKPDFEGIIIPLLADAHTHLADGFIMETLPQNLQEAVAEPNGLKHQYLNKASGEDIRSSFASSIACLEREGVGIVCDFREGGCSGVDMVKDLSSNVRTLLLGRPTPTSHFLDVLRSSDGIGLCSIVGMGEEVGEISGACKVEGKLFAFHHAEDRHEPVDPVIDADPDFVVHAAHCTRMDMGDMAAAGIGVVVCPYMNALFGSIPPMRMMLDAGLSLALGTDNAMALKPSIFETMSTAHMLSRFQRSPLTPVEIVDMTISGAKKVLNHDSPITFEKGQPSSLVVLHRPSGCTPANAANVVVTRTREKDVLLRM